MKELKKKMKFDLVWKVECSNLSVNFVDKNTPEKIRGTVSINNSFQLSQMCEKFLDFEQQLIKTKVELATQTGQFQTQEEQLKRQK